MSEYGTAEIGTMLNTELSTVPISDSWAFGTRIGFQRVPISDSWDFETRIGFQRVLISDSWN